MSELLIERLLMTGDTVGGVWTFTLELARALGAHGVSVTLAAMGGEPSPAQRAEAGRIANLRIVSSSHKLEWMDDPWADVAASGRWLRDIENEWRPQMIHLNTLGHGALPWQAPVVLTAHSCVLSWWKAVKGGRAPAEWDRYRGEVGRSLRGADALTAPSRAMLRALEANYGPDLPGERGVVPNGRSAGLFRPAPKEPFVLTAGRLWDEGKNAAAVAALAGKLYWPVYMAGEAGVKSESLAGCRMLGHLSADELAEWLGRASIYVLPARYEPFGLSALEAALSGCALVLGDIASLREIWQDAAVFVPPEDAGRLRDAVADLIGDPGRRTEMAQRALARARLFPPERMAAGFLDVYQAAAGRRFACAS